MTCLRLSSHWRWTGAGQLTVDCIPVHYAASCCRCTFLKPAVPAFGLQSGGSSRSNEFKTPVKSTSLVHRSEALSDGFCKTYRS